MSFSFLCVTNYIHYFGSCLVVDAIEITDVQSLQFDLGTIQAATNNFSNENKIGRGGFGMVYKV